MSIVNFASNLTFRSGKLKVRSYYTVIALRFDISITSLPQVTVSSPHCKLKKLTSCDTAQCSYIIKAYNVFLFFCFNRALDFEQKSLDVIFHVTMSTEQGGIIVYFLFVCLFQ